MKNLLIVLFRTFLSGFRNRQSLVLENAALRQQLDVLHRQIKRPRLTGLDRLFWVALHQVWPRWDEVLTIVKPATVIAWHREGFRLFWRWKSRPKGRRPRLDADVRTLIKAMWRDNPTWGSPRIRDELAKLDIHVSDSTIRLYRPHPTQPSSQTWKTFLSNHAGEIAAIDFFVVPTLTFRLLYVFVVMRHERREIAHVNVTRFPSAAWTAQQVVEAFPFDTSPRYVIRDRDGIYGSEFRKRVQSMGIEQVITAYRSPWQNPYVERVIGSIRRDCVDHMIVVNQDHLRKILRSYLAYYHDSRTHLGLAGDCPKPREVEPVKRGSVVALPVLGGLHHRYTRRAA